MTRRARINVLLMIGAFAAGAIGTILAFREPTVPLTGKALAAARQRWRQADIRDYDLRYRMHRSVYEVRVRDGVVVGMTVGDEPAQTADASLYSVEGLLETLQMELDNLANPGGPLAGRKNVLMRVRFNKQYGYIERDLRSAGGAGRGVAIELIEFTPKQALPERPPP